MSSNKPADQNSRPELKARTLDPRILLSGTLLDCDAEIEFSACESFDQNLLIPPTGCEAEFSADAVFEPGFDSDDCEPAFFDDSEYPEALNDEDERDDDDDRGHGREFDRDDDVETADSFLRDATQKFGRLGVKEIDDDGSVSFAPNCGSEGTETTSWVRENESGNCDRVDTTICSRIEDNENRSATGTGCSVVSEPSNGKLELTGDGCFAYTPNEGCDSDRFEYEICEETTTQCVEVEVCYDTSYEGQGGRHWGDPHFEGDDGGLYDVQGEDSAIYNMLSDKDLQYNAKFEYWNGTTGTVVGELGVLLGDDEIYFNKDGVATINGTALELGDSLTLDHGTVEYDGTILTIESEEYTLEFIAQENPWGRFIDGNYTAKNPFADGVAAHGLWGQTVDSDTDAREGDLGINVQGGGAIDTLDTDGNIVRSESGDLESVNLYRTDSLFSTTGLNDNAFFRYNAEYGTGLTVMENCPHTECDTVTITICEVVECDDEFSDDDEISDDECFWSAWDCDFALECDDDSWSQTDCFAFDCDDDDCETVDVCDTFDRDLCIVDFEDSWTGFSWDCESDVSISDADEWSCEVETADCEDWSWNSTTATDDSCWTGTNSGWGWSYSQRWDACDTGSSSDLIEIDNGDIRGSSSWSSSSSTSTDWWRDDSKSNRSASRRWGGSWNTRCR